MRPSRDTVYLYGFVSGPFVALGGLFLDAALLVGSGGLVTVVFVVLWLRTL